MFGSSLGIGGSLIPLDERLVALASLAIVVLVLVLVLGSFCPLCQGQQRLSKSSSAAVDDHDDDDEGDGNLKQFCLGSLVLQHHLSAARAWQVGSAGRGRGREGEGTCRPCADLTLAKQYKSKKDLAAGCRLIDTSPRLKIENRIES